VKVEHQSVILEMAGEGIEYIWAAAKGYHHLPAIILKKKFQK
jgi:hypothetical protein